MSNTTTASALTITENTIGSATITVPNTTSTTTETTLPNITITLITTTGITTETTSPNTTIITAANITTTVITTLNMTTTETTVPNTTSTTIISTPNMGTTGATLPNMSSAITTETTPSNTTTTTTVITAPNIITTVITTLNMATTEIIVPNMTSTTTISTTGITGANMTTTKTTVPNMSSTVTTETTSPNTTITTTAIIAPNITTTGITTVNMTTTETIVTNMTSTTTISTTGITGANMITAETTVPSMSSTVTTETTPPNTTITTTAITAGNITTTGITTLNMTTTETIVPNMTSTTTISTPGITAPNMTTRETTVPNMSSTITTETTPPNTTIATTAIIAPNITTTGITTLNMTTTETVAQNTTSTTIISTQDMSTTGITSPSISSTITTETTPPNTTITTTAITAGNVTTTGITTLSMTTTETIVTNMSSTTTISTTGITASNMTKKETTVPNMASTTTTETTFSTLTTISTATSATVSNISSASWMQGTGTLLPFSTVPFSTMTTMMLNATEMLLTTTVASVEQNINNSTLATTSMLPDITIPSLVPATETVLPITTTPLPGTATMLPDANTESLRTESMMAHANTTLSTVTGQRTLSTMTVLLSTDMTETRIPDTTTSTSLGAGSTMLNMAMESSTGIAKSILPLTTVSSSPTGTTLSNGTAESLGTESRMPYVNITSSPAVSGTMVSDTSQALFKSSDNMSNSTLMLQVATTLSSEASTILFHATEQVSETATVTPHTITLSSVLETKTMQPDSTTLSETVGIKTMLPGTSPASFPVSNTISNMTMASSAGLTETLLSFTTLRPLITAAMLPNTTAESLTTETTMAHANATSSISTAQNNMSNMTIVPSTGPTGTMVSDSSQGSSGVGSTILTATMGSSVEKAEAMLPFTAVSPLVTASTLSNATAESSGKESLMTHVITVSSTVVAQNTLSNSTTPSLATMTRTMIPDTTAATSLEPGSTAFNMTMGSSVETAKTMLSFATVSLLGTGTMMSHANTTLSTGTAKNTVSETAVISLVPATEMMISHTTQAPSGPGSSMPNMGVRSSAEISEAIQPFSTISALQAEPMPSNSAAQSWTEGSMMPNGITPSSADSTNTIVTNITEPSSTAGSTIPNMSLLRSTVEAETVVVNTTVASLTTEVIIANVTTVLSSMTTVENAVVPTASISVGRETMIPGANIFFSTASEGTTLPLTTTSSPATTAAMLSNTTTSSFVSTESATFQDGSTMALIMPAVNRSCYPPVIILSPTPSTLSSPSEYQRSQNIYMTSYLQLNCNESFSATKKWTVKECSSSCTFEIQLDQSIITTRSELFIPAKTLSYGTYELKLSVTMMALSNSTSFISTFITINPSSVIVNLVQFGTSMITHGFRQNLTLNPGAYSTDPDTITFNTSNWNYDYYCRIDGHYNFPSINGSMLTINDSRIDSINSSCFGNQPNNRTSWQYAGSKISDKSALIILSGSLVSNQTYQFTVMMTHRQNSYLKATGSVLVHVQDSNPHMIAIVCVISSMCIPDIKYQYVNPTTQVALASICIDDCKTVQSITWNIYQGLMNSSSNSVQWTLFNEMNTYRDIWFFGMNTSNFTAINKLFIDNPSIIYWRFEVVYSFSSESSSSSLSFVINRPPQNGFCSISPTNGTTSTLFTISCFNWTDDDGIKDYSFYGWTTNPTDRVMFAHSYVSNIQLLLSTTDDNTSLINIIVYIRDSYDCAAEFNISSIIIVPDWTYMENLIANFQNSTNDLFVQMLSSGNQNMVSQVVTSLSQQFNIMNNQAIKTALANGISSTTIAISPLGSKTQQPSSVSLNASALVEYNKQLNTYANVRDSLITYITNLMITTADSIKLQASSLAQLTQATNQLTRTTLMLASDKCYQLAWSLHSMVTTITSEDVQTAANYIAQCANNVLSSVNGPLQQRTTILDSDWSRANNFPVDYDTNLESEWANPNLFAYNNDFSWETIQKGRNSYYQKQMADQINTQTTETISLITKALNIHLNIGQNLIMNTSSILLSVETISIDALSNKLIQQVGNAQIRIPPNFTLTTNDNTSISLRSIMQPLALADNTQLQSNTNLSTSLSLTIFDRNGNEIPIQTDINHPIELIILRDPNIIIPSMTLQNVTSMNMSPHYQLFNLHFIDITQSQWNNNRTVALTFEMHPLNISLAYLLIYRFDNSPQLNSSINQIDGWTLFCPSNLTNDSLYTYFLNNQQTSGHQSVIFGLRELNSTEFYSYCMNSSINSPPITNQPFNFTSNYELRSYTACCYYLNSNNIWQTDGLLVGSQTNHYQTQCFSTHLTTFAGGFLVLPAPINWNYVFANADFMKNKTVYLTIICIYILYFLLVIYARYKDKKDIEKLGVTPLPDNYFNDQYFYQILVFTGNRKNAGTKSKVQFILVGDNDETSVRTFADPHRKVLQHGGIDAFIMAVPKSLGSLNYIRIWHDNTGHGASASWFLKYIIVRDLQTMEKFYFICQEWFAVEKGDGRVSIFCETQSKRNI
ncbi:unnamed protein product [Rotaria sp. Silwood2]|nr:unnamed protein product [Rotaria sp. Silwood2]